MKKIRFKNVRVGQRFKRTPEADAWDRRIKDELTNSVKSGKVNIVGVDDGVHAHISDGAWVWVER